MSSPAALNFRRWTNYSIIVEIRYHRPLFFSSMFITGFCLQKCLNFLGHRGVAAVACLCSHGHLTAQGSSWGMCQHSFLCLSSGCGKEAEGLDVTASLICCLRMSPPSPPPLFFLHWWSTNHALCTNTTSKEVKLCWLFCIRQNCRIQLTGNMFVHAIIYFMSNRYVAKPRCAYLKSFHV